MKNVEIRQQGRWWRVIANGEFVGRYDNEEDAREVAIVCRHTRVWPPRSGVTGIYWHLGRWETRSGKRFANLADAKEAVKCKKAEHKAPEDKIMAGREHCKTCVWRLVTTHSTNGNVYFHCGYSLCFGHQSRIALHYQRTGKQSLEGFTTGENCTEYMAGDPREKLSLLQDDVSKVTSAGWALLKREKGIAEGREKQKREPYQCTVDMDMEMAERLRELHTWQEIANVTGLSINGARGAWLRHRINKNAADKIRESFGIDVTGRTK